MRFGSKLKFIGLFIGAITLLGCSQFNQGNVYGNGHYPSHSDENTNETSQSSINDYQAFQVNFVTISVDQVNYSVTETLSYITLHGVCLNPGFETNSIYYRAYDQQGYDIATDGYPYLTNKVYFAGTQKLQPINLSCKTNGIWSTVIEVPTHILYALKGGRLEVSLVVWYKGEEMHNQSTGLTSAPINPPDIQIGPTDIRQ